MKHERGFSMVEMIMILVLLGLGSTVLIRLYGRSVGSLDDNAAIQTGAQIVQECADHFLGARRRTGYAAVAATNCAGLALPASYSVLSVQSTVTAGTGGCPTGATCTSVSITASDATHGTVASGALLLVQ